jgi:hypothetical protein
MNGRNITMSYDADRRLALKGLGVGLVTAGLVAGRSAQAAGEAALAPAGARTPHDLTERLAVIPRRRDYKTVPMIADSDEWWDAAALNAVFEYKGGPKQCWDHTDLAGPWLNLMRNSLNTEIWSFRHPDFLCVSATHGPAHLALYDQAMWDKYQLAKIAGGNIASNTFTAVPPAAAHDAADFQALEGAFSSKNNSITVLQRRGAVFLACHNAIWELSERLSASGQNPDHVGVDGIAAELTNHLIPGIVLTPGAVATAIELQRVGFLYCR